MSDLSKIKLNGTVYHFKDAVARTPNYGTCSTAKATVQKEVSIPNVTTLTTGLTVFVKFTATNTATDPTLKINTLDAAPIKRYGTTAASTSAASSWNAGAVIALTYDGTNFIMNDWNNTTYSAMTEAEMQGGTSTTSRLITPARLKAAIEYHTPAAPVQSVNGATGAVVIDALKTTAADGNTEYDLIGTAQSNTDTAAVAVYRPTFLSVAKTDDFSRLTIGSTTKPGILRLYSSASGATGYTDLKSGSSSTNTRTITLPDATGTVALTSDIPNVSAWALAANKPSYTFSELITTPTSLGGYGITDAYTKTEVDGMVSGVLHYKGTKATVAALPSSGNTTGDVWHVTADGSEWAWDGSDWQELGTAVDLSGYVPTSRTVNGKALTSDISLTASDVSALPSNTTYVSSFNGSTGAITYTAPVTSVNGQTGAVTLTIPSTAADVGALADDSAAAGITSTDISNWNAKLSSFTETDPVFSASAAAGITSSDISNWNAKVSDTGKWNGVALDKTSTTSNADIYLAKVNSVTESTAAYVKASTTPTANCIPKYTDTSNPYLQSSTPTSGDSSTKVATTAFVQAAIPQPYNASTNPTGYLTINDLPLYDGSSSNPS